MAIDITAAADLKVLFAPQATFGTATADSVAAVGFQAELADIQEEVQVLEGPQVNGVRYETDDDLRVDTTASMPKFQLTVPRLRSANIDQLMYLFMQSTSEGVGTPYEQTMAFPVDGAAQQPDFSVNAGFFGTFWKRFPTTARSQKIIDVIAAGATITCPLNGYLSGVFDLAGRGAVTPNASQTGTITPDSGNGFHYGNIVRHTVNFGAGAVAVDLHGAWVIELTQEVIKVSPGSGTFGTYGLVKRRGTFTVNFLADANMVTAWNNLQAETPLTFNAGFGSGTAGSTSGDLDFTIRGKIAESITNTHDDVVACSIKCRMTGASGGAASPLTIITANGTQRNW